MNSFTLAPQTRVIYQTLLKAEALTAQEIGAQLNIFPHSVYRAINQLSRLGCVEKNSNRPMRFRAKNPSDAVTTYLTTHRSWFLDNFPDGIHKPTTKNSQTSSLDVSFIQSRQELLEKSLNDQKHAHKELALIVSGDEVPAEVMLENKRALERGVQIKILAQKPTEANQRMYKNWRRMGIQVKITPSIESRIIIVDSEIVYITSYNPKKNSEGVGVRFAYVPIAELMHQLFDQQWNKAKEF